MLSLFRDKTGDCVGAFADEGHGRLHLFLAVLVDGEDDRFLNHLLSFFKGGFSHLPFQKVEAALTRQEAVVLF